MSCIAKKKAIELSSSIFKDFAHLQCPIPEVLDPIQRDAVHIIQEKRVVRANRLPGQLRRSPGSVYGGLSLKPRGVILLLDNQSLGRQKECIVNGLY